LCGGGGVGTEAATLWGTNTQSKTFKRGAKKGAARWTDEEAERESESDTVLRRVGHWPTAGESADPS